MVVAKFPAVPIKNALRGGGQSSTRRTNFAYLSDGMGRLWIALVELRRVEVLETVRVS